MDGFSRVFSVTVIAVDLLAIVYFGGHFVLTGHVLPEHGSGHEQQMVLNELVPVASADAPKKAVKKVEEKLLPASPERGKKVVAGICVACHNFAEGAGSKIGPDLWGVFGREIAHVSGFNYSSAFMKMGGQHWDEEKLEHFLANPRKYAPGTKMSFAGLHKAQERLDVISFLKTLHD